MKIFITGASGFIGRHLIEELLKFDVKIVALYRKSPVELTGNKSSVVWVQGDIVNDDLRGYLKGCNFVFHLAADLSLDNSTQARDELNRNNITGTSNIVKAAIDAKVQKIVYVSSIAACEAGNGKVITEKTGHPLSFYGESKLGGERELIALTRGKVNYLIFRPVAVFGEYHKGSVYEMVRVIYQNRFIMIGRGNNAVNFLYVKDLVGFLIRGCLSNLKNEIFIVNQQRKHTLREFSDIISSELGKKPMKIYIPKFLGKLVGLFADIIKNILKIELPISQKRVEAMCRNIYYSPAKLFAEKDFCEKYGLAKGISETINWYKTQGLL